MIHATGKVAETVIEGLKSQPLALPLVIINIMALGIVGYVLWIAAARSEARDALITELAKNCQPISSPKN